MTTTSRHRQAGRVSGPAGNERLTALTGAVLLIGFAVEGITVLSVSRLLTLHFFLGMLLVGPVALKICSTCYRFARYYAGAAPYVRRGPPATLLRVLGPFVILSSVAVLGTGVVLAFAGPQHAGPWLFLHKASFIAWFAVMTIHVCAYAWQVPVILLRRQPDGRLTVRGGLTRWLLVAAALAAGLVLALATIDLAAAWR